MTFNDLGDNTFALLFFIFGLLVYSLFLHSIIKNIKINNSFSVGGITLLIAHLIVWLTYCIREELWFTTAVVPTFFTLFAIFATVSIAFFVLFFCIGYLIEQIP